MAGVAMVSCFVMLARVPVESRLLRPIIYSRPARLVWPPSWAAHIPFAFWLIDAMRPRTFVELGTHTGVSYSAFAQAVQVLGLESACYAVDTWQGDAQAGYYTEDVFAEWSAFHDRQFGAFSRLLRSTFDDALEHFADRSIDLLHIDGLHTYDAVRHDFESWLPKLSARGVVLFHDINVREDDFGAWKLWEEVCDRYPSFAFLHGHGLGLLAVGHDPAPDVQWLATSRRSPDEAAVVQRVFATVGEVWNAHLLLERARAEAAESATSLREELARVADERQRLAAEREALADTVHTDEAELVEVTARLAEVSRERHLLEVQLAQLSRDREVADARLTELAAERDAAIEAGEELSSERANAARLGAEVRTAAERLEHQARSLQEGRGRLVRVRAEMAQFERRAVVAESGSAERAPARQRLRLTARFWRRQPAIVADRLRAAGLAKRNIAAHPRRVLHVLTRSMRAIRALVEESGLFDPHYYLAQQPDSAGAGTAPLDHFLRTGAETLASPHPLFDTAYYLRQHPALAGSGWNPLVYYLAFGAREGVDPHPLFSTRYYLEGNPDNGAAAPLAHFVRYGAQQGRSPHPLFDVPFYDRRRPDVRAHGVNPLRHYLERALLEDIDPHPLFDTSFYLEQAEPLREMGVNALVHFLAGGWRDGLWPNAWFDPEWYVEHYPDVAGVMNPLLHYTEHGGAEGRDPSPLFSSAGYLTQNPDVAATRTNPLRHYLEFGILEARTGGVTDVPTRPAEAPAVPIRATGTSSSPPTILCVSHVSPWPIRAGNEYRVARMLDHLQRRGHRIVLVLAPLPNEPMAEGAFDRIAEQYGNLVLCQRDGQVTFRLRDCPDVLSTLDSSRPASADEDADCDPRFRQADLAYCHGVVEAVVLALSRALGRCAVLAEYIFMTRFFHHLGPDVLRIVDTHDVFSSKGAKVGAFGIASDEMSAEDEARRLERADVVVGIHPDEVIALSRLCPAREVLLAGVDVDVLPPSAWPDDPAVFVVGSGNRMNTTGLREFLRFAWPRVLAEVPNARLRVAGDVGRAVAPGTPSVTMLGHVPDLAAEYRAARVVINPTVAGTGLKVKTIEALAYRRPVVGWPHNRDGLSKELRAFVDEATDWQTFAELVVQHLRLTCPPFGEDVVATLTRELSGEVVYAELDERLARFFSRAGVGHRSVVA